MIWRFLRRKEEIRLETWYDKHTSEFVVDIAHPDGQRDSKRFANGRVYRTWLAAWDEKLVAQGWMQSGPFLSVSEPHRSHPMDAAVVRHPSTDGADPITARTYASGARVFELTLSGAIVNGHPLWTVALVTVTSGQRVSIPGMQSVVSSTPDGTFARACDCIDKWLAANPSV